MRPTWASSLPSPDEKRAALDPKPCLGQAPASRVYACARELRQRCCKGGDAFRPCGAARRERGPCTGAEPWCRVPRIALPAGSTRRHAWTLCRQRKTLSRGKTVNSISRSAGRTLLVGGVRHIDRRRAVLRPHAELLVLDHRVIDEPFGEKVDYGIGGIFAVM